MTEANDYIEVLGARVHNLKNIDVLIPREKLVVITGLSGSGKSSLAFDTIYAEGQRRYIETFSAYARQFLGGLERPDVDKINGLSPVIAIEQKTTNKSPRSTVGTVTEIYDFLRLLYARAGDAFSHVTGEKMISYTDEQIHTLISKDFYNQRISVLAPVVRARKGHYRELFEQILRNLLSNAIKYSQENGIIFVNLEKENNHIVCKIIDNGIGISKEDLEKIGSRFYRSQKVEHAEIKGTGLGLSIVKRLTDLLAIQFNIESQLKFGTMVTLRFF